MCVSVWVFTRIGKDVIQRQFLGEAGLNSEFSFYLT